MSFLSIPVVSELSSRFAQVGEQLAQAGELLAQEAFATAESVTDIANI